MLSLLDESTKLGALRATLEVRVSNSAAIALYHKYGFEIVSRRKRYYVDNNEDAYLMNTPPFETGSFQANLDDCRRQLRVQLLNPAGGRTSHSDASGLTIDESAVLPHGEQVG